MMYLKENHFTLPITNHVPEENLLTPLITNDVPEWESLNPTYN